MKKILFAVLAAVGMAGSGQAQESPENAFVSQSLELAAFDKISVSGPFKVSVYVTDAPTEVVLTGPPSMIADTIAEVDSGALAIRFSEGADWSWTPGSGMHLLVTVPALSVVEVHGAGQVEILQIRGEVFEASTSGSGSITLQNMDVGEARFATGGSGSIMAEGIARSGRYATSGSGSIDAKRLRVADADIAVGGSGSIFADVSGRANVVVEGSGSADIVGGAECETQDRGSGSIECR